MIKLGVKRKTWSVTKLVKRKMKSMFKRKKLCKAVFPDKFMKAAIFEAKKFGGKKAPAAGRFMKAAIFEAKKSLLQGGIPIGSVLVKNGKIIGKGRNQRVQKQNPMLHAEIDCLQNAGRVRSYKGTVLYSTLMPCFLCAGAIVEFKIPKIVAGESKNYAGAKKFLQSHHVKVIDLGNVECIQMLRSFKKKNPKLWKEDIGRL